MTNIIALLHRAGQVADERFGEGKSGLTPRQQIVLAAVAELDQPSQTQLVEATGIDRSTMADLVRRLSTNGFIKRRRTRADARRYAVALTDKGAEAARRATATAETVSDALLETLPVRLRQPFVTALTRISTPTVEAAE